MSLRSKIDFSELNAFKTKMQITSEEYNAFLKDCLIDFGEEAVELAKLFTPVDTGALKSSWGLATKWMVPQHTELWSNKKQRMVNKTLFIRGGGVRVNGEGTKMSVTISNPQKYAQIVEYQYGYYMLEQALAIVRSEMPGLYEARFNKFKAARGL